MQLILGPPGRIALYVGTDLIQRDIVANDMLPIIALPDRGAGGTPHAIDPRGHSRFVPGNERSQGTG